ncbi:MAG: polysaccharide deacetylase family protein [Acidobacteriota bacterium]|nr:polysaccharide deacetylase family protein [Acidobacteriota bacterium]
MIGPITLKRTVKQTAGWAAVLSRLFTEPSSRRACIFYYHRIADVSFTDSRIDDWNVTPPQFERQIAALTNFAEIVPLMDLQRRLKTSVSNAKPLVCLTFDDGYANFHSQVLPILKRYKAPATAFVVTGSVGSPQPMPFDRWAHKNHDRVQADTWRSLSWSQLEDCVASGLVTVGAHSHRHLRGSQCTTDQIAEEAERSREILRMRLGKAHSVQYAYPYGNTKLGDVSAQYKSAVKAAGYELAVTTDLGLAHAHQDPYSLPRLEAHMLDSPGVLKAKATGALAPYRLTDHFRAAYRA